LNILNSAIHILFVAFCILPNDFFSRCLKVIVTVLPLRYDKTFSERNFARVGLISFIAAASGLNDRNWNRKIMSTFTNVDVDLGIDCLISFDQFEKKLALMPFLIGCFEDVIFQKLSFI